jgi:ribosomal protein S18 acetylase RimI-like enzyme
MLRLEPMTEEEFQESLARSIARHASDRARRGLWSEAGALEASRAEYDELLPQGRATPSRHFCTLIDNGTGGRVGETWYTVEERGGKVRFWIEWLWIDPAHRRRGHATEALRRLEAEARTLGADRTGLNVWTDNPGAMELYRKLGYTPASLQMMKPIG